MKKLKWVILISLVAVLAFGCQKQQEEKTEKKTTKSTEEKKQEKSTDTQEAKEEGNPEEQTQQPSQEPQVVQKITVYVSNENADGFVQEEAEVSSLTAGEVLRCLTEKRVIPEGIQVNDCQMTQVDGQSMLHLDLNTAFQDYVGTLGTTGEYLTIGGVANTFMTAYGCMGIQITVDGQVLTTGHAEYPGYLSLF
ncbi:GerMN domain-containing protein [Clostridiaceae bacterium 68-1-5]|uniref:GerMN domain-containing protein n=1 Tax=Suipraeoptans intestinalis TaxID=2606628 RepID=A0A6N7UXY5_9FIRM|nr:GerMN domain-containing protein [Suipraeoptans intestinalis]MSR93089.1 GerMN domain-containing protein [Suipraeoptans intestinalis]